MVITDKNALTTVKKVAVMSDIHSNYFAFRACCDDAVAHGVQGFVFLGDYVSDLSEIRPTLDLLYDICENYSSYCLRGNRERYMLSHKNGITHFAPGAGTGSLFYTYERLTESELEVIERLKYADSINIGGIDFELAHSAPDNDRRYFDHVDGGAERIFDQMTCKYLLTGHSHKQYAVEKSGKSIINPGSVGEPHCGDSRAQYAIIEIDGGRVVCTQRQVDYDVEKAIHAQFESGLVDCGKYWPIAILYDVITGKELCTSLLKRVLARDGSEDEAIWREEAEKMGMRFTEKEILEVWREKKA